MDGTALPTYRIKEAYHTGLHSAGPDGDEPAAGAERELVETRAAALLSDAISEKSPAMFFVGVGDHGGGPTQVAIDAVQRIRAQTSGEVAFGSTSSFFGQISRALAQGGTLPSVRGDLHMHAVGCYTVVAWMKRENAACEAALAAAENLAGVCELATGVRLDVQDTLRSAWTRVLFNQFHDSLGGTCTEEVCEDLRQFYGYARTQADAVVTRATQLLAMRADTAVEGSQTAERNQSLNPFVAHFPVPLVVFNPLSRPVRVPLELPHPATSVTVAATSRFRSSRSPPAKGPGTPTTAWWWPTSRPWATACSGSAWMTSPARPRRRRSQPSRAAGERRPRGRRRSAGRRGHRDHLQTDRPPVAGPGGPAPGGAGRPQRHLVPLRRPLRGTRAGLRLVDVTEAEAGPVRTVVRLQYAWDASTVWMDLILYAGLPGLEVKLRADWHQRHQLLKLIAPFAVDAPVIDAGVPYGTVERAADGGEEVSTTGSASGSRPALAWCAVPTSATPMTPGGPGPVHRAPQPALRRSWAPVDDR